MILNETNEPEWNFCMTRHNTCKNSSLGFCWRLSASVNSIYIWNPFFELDWKPVIFPKELSSPKEVGALSKGSSFVGGTGNSEEY